MPTISIDVSTFKIIHKFYFISQQDQQDLYKVKD
jgi:hypothetical protein